MAFHFESEEQARAAIYDAALTVLLADAAIALPLSTQTIQELSNLCARIANGDKVSRSPLLDC